MDIKKTLEHCIEWNCVDCPNKDELGSGNIVCRARLFPKILAYINNLEAKLAEYKSKTRVAFRQLASFQLQYDDLKKEYKEQEDLLEKTLATNSKLQLELDQLKQQLTESDKTIEELKGERLKFYTDDVRRTQVINGVHFDIDQLLVFSEYVEHEKWVISNRDKEIVELKHQLSEKERLIGKVQQIIDKLRDKKFACQTLVNAVNAVYEPLYQPLYQNKCDEVEELKQQLEEKEKMHLLDENEFQRYCAYKHIEPQIKGCLDREIAYEKEIEELKQSQNQIAIEKLENLKEIINNNAVDFEKGIHIISTELLIGHIDYKIKKLRGDSK